MQFNGNGENVFLKNESTRNAPFIHPFLPKDCNEKKSDKNFHPNDIWHFKCDSFIYMFTFNAKNRLQYKKIIERFLHKNFIPIFSTSSSSDRHKLMQCSNSESQKGRTWRKFYYKAMGICAYSAGCSKLRTIPTYLSPERMGAPKWPRILQEKNCPKGTNWVE